VDVTVDFKAASRCLSGSDSVSDPADDALTLGSDGGAGRALGHRRFRVAAIRTLILRLVFMSKSHVSAKTGSPPIM
jgi:hypothetical protein